MTLEAFETAVHQRSFDDRAVLVDGLPFPVVLADRLLPGDPRVDRAAAEFRGKAPVATRAPSVTDRQSHDGNRPTG